MNERENTGLEQDGGKGKGRESENEGGTETEGGRVREKKRDVPRKERSCWQGGIDTRSVRAFRCAVLRALF